MSELKTIHERRKAAKALLQDIVHCCALNNWAESTFGRKFNGDPNFVRELHTNRDDMPPRRIQARTRAKLRGFLLEHGVAPGKNW